MKCIFEIPESRELKTKNSHAISLARAKSISSIFLEIPTKNCSFSSPSPGSQNCLFFFPLSVFAPLFKSNSAAALRPSCAASIRAVRSSSSEEGRNALMFAAQEGHKATAGMLLNKGANINAANNYGDTNLMLTFRNDFETVAALLHCSAATVSKSFRIVSIRLVSP